MNYQEKEEFFIFTDVETTGFCPIRNDVWQICLIATDKSYNEISRYTAKMKPTSTKFISDKALEISGMTFDNVMRFDNPKDKVIEITQWFNSLDRKTRWPSRLIFHAVNNFDWNHIDWLFKKQDMQYDLYKHVNWKNLESTLTIARGMKDHLNCNNYKLNTLCQLFDIPLNHHDAESDTQALIPIHKELKRYEMA